MDLEDNDIETIWFETYPYKSKRSLFIGGSIDHRLLRQLMIRSLEKTSKMYASWSTKHSFVKTLKTLNLTQLVQVITWPKSRTCLDHIWCTYLERIINLRVLNSGLSDHLLILSSRIYKRARKHKGEHTITTYRDIKSPHQKRFIASLRQAPWDCAIVFNDTNDVLDAWYNILTEL